MKKNFMDTLPFIISSNAIKYVEPKINNEKREFYRENIKSLIKKDIKKWKDILCWWINIIIIRKMTVLPTKRDLRIKGNCNQHTHIILDGNRKKIPDFPWSQYRSWNATTILTKKNKTGEIVIPDFKKYCGVIVAKSNIEQGPNSHADQ